MLLNDTRISSNPEPFLKVGFMGKPTAENPEAPAGYSDAIDRSRFLRTSIHIPGKTFTLQVSNMDNPKQAPETDGSTPDWIDIAETTTGFIDTDLVAKYFRVKCDTLVSGDRIYIVSIFSKY